MLSELHNTLGSLRCPYGHGGKISYVNQANSAKKRFICDTCLFEDSSSSFKDAIKLDSYFNFLANQVTRQANLSTKTMEEVETKVKLATKLKKDLTDSVLGIRESVDRHYEEFIENLKLSALKAKTRIQEKIERDFKHALTEITAIETNLFAFKNGELLTGAADILDQSADYLRRKPVADNSLYDLLSGLNVKSSIRSTKQRLSQFAARYVRRKVAMVQSVKDSLADRQVKDADLCKDFLSEKNTL